MKLAIIGYPLTHSLSGVMQNAALRSCGIDGEYEIIETRPEDLVSTIKKLRTQGYQGFNVTIPHKVPITLFLDQFDEMANLTGSVNTVKILEDKTLEGYNTDVYGFVHSLPEDLDLKGKKAAVLGTGGASRAICAGLSALGVSEVDLFTRNIIDSHENAQQIRNRFKNVKFNLIQNQMLKDLGGYEILVNTTPLGMKSFAQDASPLGEDVVKTLPDDALICDIVYNPPKTELIRHCIRHSKRYVGGLDMLVLQGAKAFEIWTGQAPDVAQMKIAALEGLV